MKTRRGVILAALAILVIVLGGTLPFLLSYVKRTQGILASDLPEGKAYGYLIFTLGKRLLARNMADRTNRLLCRLEDYPWSVDFASSGDRGLLWFPGASYDLRYFYCWDITERLPDKRSKAIWDTYENNVWVLPKIYRVGNERFLLLCNAHSWSPDANLLAWGNRPDPDHYPGPGDPRSKWDLLVLDVPSKEVYRIDMALPPQTFSWVRRLPACWRE
jgi:hypothetical protein